MEFDDDREFDDGFDADIADDDTSDTEESKKTVKPKKVARKGFRQAKKKNADKEEDTSESRKSPFHRRSAKGEQREEDTDADMPVFRDKGIGSDTDSTAATGHSEFGYLFAPPREGESDDDVYPDSSIYSDGTAAKSLLSGLGFDGTHNSGTGGEPDMTPTRPTSQFSSHGGGETALTGAFTSSGSGAESLKPTPISFDAAPSPASVSGETDSYLPALRPDSVFISQDDRKPTPTATPAPVSAHESETAASEHDVSHTAAEPSEQPVGEQITQEFLPYGSMYPTYQMNGMNPMGMGGMTPMMPYPMIIPTGGQNQGNVPYQTIPIPYPMPMPMPMPMYNQYPQYMPPMQPQYIIQQPQPAVQPQAPVQPSQPTPPPSRSVRRDDEEEDWYGARGYDDRGERYDYEDRRSSRDSRGRYREEDRYAGCGGRYDYDRRDVRGDRYDRRDRYSRYDDYDDGYNERAAARYQDARRGRYERRSERYYDRIDARRYGDERPGDRPAERKHYTSPSYLQEPVVEPIVTERTMPAPDPTPLITNTPMTPPAPAASPMASDRMSTGFDLAFDSPSDNISDFNSIGMNAFGSESFDPNGTSDSDYVAGNTFRRF